MLPALIEEKQVSEENQFAARPKVSPVKQAQVEPAKKKLLILPDEEPVEEDEFGIPALFGKK